jgi:hypothetical protein
MKPVLIKLQNTLNKAPAKLDLHPALEDFALFSTKVFWYVCAGGLFYISVLIVLMAAEHAGKSNAERYIEKIKDGDIAVDKFLVEAQKGNNVEFEGYSIVCNGQQCAYFNGKKSEVFNHNSVKSLESIPVTNTP